MSEASLPLLSETSLAADARGTDAEARSKDCSEAEAHRRAVRALRVALQVAGRIAREGGLSGTLHAVEAAEFKLLDEVGLEAFAACTAGTFQPPCAAGVGTGAECGERRGGGWTTASAGRAHLPSPGWERGRE